jgi:alkylhydroperoxidase/carboxymuconolactone decarboxylase family protein YurZ
MNMVDTSIDEEKSGAAQRRTERRPGGTRTASTDRAAELVTGFLHSGLRPAALAPKVRALTALAAATVSRVPASELRAHVRHALASGAIADEVLATMSEAALYAGFAAAHAGFEAALSVFGDTYPPAKDPWPIA